MDSSDDDIPGLESVSGSEFVEDSEDESDEGFLSPEEERPKGAHLVATSLWYRLDGSVIAQHVEVVRIYVLSPFLYGHAHQSDCWLKWCHDVGLLASDVEFCVEKLTDREISAMDIIIRANTFAHRSMAGERQNLARILHLMEEIEKESTAVEAAHRARRWRWFNALIDEVRDEAVRGGLVKKEYLNSKLCFVEIGCLFVFNQVNEHVHGVNRGKQYHLDYERQLRLHEENGEGLRQEGEELEKAGKFHEAVQTYNIAIICSPYYYRLYVNRAYALIELKDFRNAIGDSLRAINLQPQNSIAHCCHIKALQLGGEVEKCRIATRTYNQQFPSERDDIKRTIKQLRHKYTHQRKRDPTEQERLVNDNLLVTCKQASEAYLAGNLDEAIFYFQEALASSQQNDLWKVCWVFSECEKFSLSLHFAYGLALLSKGGNQNAEKAISQFNVIISDYQFITFPPAYYGMGKSLALLHNHMEARKFAKKGLDMIPEYYAILLDWPGTSEHITECLPNYIEGKLKQLQQQCQPTKVADAVCRYSNCRGHHNSSNIVVDASDYKGHVQMQCDEGCLIAYHPGCWRKFKGDSVISLDKDFLGTQCPTPDCEGCIKIVSIHDSDKKTKPKKFEMDLPPKRVTPAVSSPAMVAKDSKRSKPKKRSLEDSTSTSVSSKAVESAGGGEEGLKGETGKVKEGKVKEDLRRIEDSLAVINRQAEQEEEEQDGAGTVSAAGAGSRVSKVKKRSQLKERSKEENELLKDLFTHPERDVYDDNNQMSKWEPSPALPFLPPKHLRDKIDDFEINEAPSIGLPPRPLGGGSGSAPPSEELPGQPSAKLFTDEDMEFFVSYFGEILRTHGPLKPSDSDISEALCLLPEDRREKIEKAGGLAKILVNSGHFAMNNGLICPVERLPPASDGGSLTNSGASNEGDSVKKSAERNGATETKPVSDRSALSGLLSMSHSRTEGDGGTASSKMNTSALNVKASSPFSSPDVSKKGLKPAAKKSDDVPKKSRSRKEKEAVVASGKKKGPVGVKETRKTQSRASSKDSSVYSSGNEGRGGEGAESGLVANRRDVFSPTNSTSSMSSESSSSNAAPVTVPDATPDPPPPPPPSLSHPPGPPPSAQLKVTATFSGGKKNKTFEPVKAKPLLKCVESGAQTDLVLKADKWVMTDTIPPVESFKDRYEAALKEKKDLQEKLERSEDQRFKLQKTHKREVEQLLKQAKHETREEFQGKVQEMEERVKSEGARVEAVRKENSEQLRSSKAEVKSLLDKIERMKKDSTKKDSQHENKLRQLRMELDQLVTDKSRYEDRLKSLKDTEAKAIVRATNAEVEVLSMRSDLVTKPWEHKIRELEAMCMTIPQGTDMYQECLGYREKMKAALETYQSAVENQLRLVKAGKDLSALDRIPNPAVPMPPQLGMMLMRPGFYHPMMSVPRAPFGMPAAGMMDPSLMMNKPHPPAQAPVSSMSQPEQPESNSRPNLPPLSLNTGTTSTSGSDKGQASASATASSPPEGGGDTLNGGSYGSGKKSSFDRIVEKLGPMYPLYTREDFKTFLRDVRRSNKNTLSGLSLDSIAQQVKSIIEQREQRERRGGGKGSAGGGARGGANKQPSKGVAGKNRSAQDKRAKKSNLPAVTTAPPPVQSPVDYDENSCIICYEDMGAKNTSRLDCGHSFHSECIRSWFKEQSTCPTCRNHSLLVEEYPTLK